MEVHFSDSSFGLRVSAKNQPQKATSQQREQGGMTDELLYRDSTTNTGVQATEVSVFSFLLIFSGINRKRPSQD